MAITLLCLTIGGVALSALNLFGGGLLIFWTRRKRDAFWLIPLVNLLLYSGAVMWRPHPLGFGAQFWGWQLLVLSLEISVIVLMSLIWTTLLVLIRWGVEALRRQEKGSKTVTSAPDAAASTGIGS